MFTLFIAALVNFLYVYEVFGCMPGYQYERQKLEEYLGIGWIEKGLNVTAYSATKTIRHASDLDCTFSEPEKCPWTNVEASKNLDTLDFHLFEKTDSKEFPIVQVRPGPSKVRRGDKFIFTGDRKNEEQSAIWLSSPIKCQNSTGTLSFTFWLYNSARVEVIILEKRSDRFVILPEKPFVDCGILSINTECIAVIPPHSTQFSLGIRAYDINQEDGSFVMIDNIFYEASFCKIGVDLGDEFHGEPFMNVLDSDAVIISANELNCYDFDSSCKWAPMGYGTETWKIAKQSPSQSHMFNATKTFVTPDPPFAFLYIEQDHKAPFNILRSSFIACQTNQPSSLTLRFWTTPEVLLEACAIDQKQNNIECHTLPMAQSPNPIQIELEAQNTFMIAIRVQELNTDYDNFIAIDDISYSAVMCSEANDAWDLGLDFFTAPLLSVLRQRPILSSKDLDCSFDHRGVDCLWANYNDQSPQWLIASTPIDQLKLFSLTGTMQLPANEFAVVRLKGTQSAHLISEVIRCVSNNAMLSFRFWETGSARINICLLEENKPDLVDCQRITLEQPGPVIIDIPILDHPFRIALRAEITSDGEHVENTGLVIIDDLQLSGDICISRGRANGIKTASFQSIQRPDPNVCRLLSCQFEYGQTCLFTSTPIASSSNHFHAYDGFAEANLLPHGNIAILESPLFTLNAPAHLHFSYYKDISAVLSICHDSMNRELDGCFEVLDVGDISHFKNDFVKVLPSDTKVYFIAKLRDGFSTSHVIISNITLTDLDDSTCT